MVIDSSALVAIFLGEPERQIFRSLMIQAESRLISAVNVFETGVVLEAKGGMALSHEYDLFLVRANIQVIAADAEQTELARSAWRKYGKGRHRERRPAGCRPRLRSRAEAKGGSRFGISRRSLTRGRLAQPFHTYRATLAPMGPGRPRLPAFPRGRYLRGTPDGAALGG